MNPPMAAPLSTATAMHELCACLFFEEILQFLMDTSLNVSSLIPNSVSGFSLRKNTVICGKITVFGTPGETRTHYLTLRRRTLYPGELRGHGYEIDSHAHELPVRI